MAIGIYKATKRRKELSSTFFVFANNLQIWLAVFAFSTFIFATFWKYIWRWFHMLAELSPIGWFAFIIGGIIVLFFGVMSIYSLLKLARLLWHAKFGEIVRYDPETTPSNLLAAIEPIESSEKNTKQYIKALGKLVEQNNALIAHNNELISKYVDIVHKTDTKDKK